MRRLAEFVKTALIGGLLVILPIYVSIILIAKAVRGILAAMKPITAVVPASVQFREIVAVLVVVAVCFVAGLIVVPVPDCVRRMRLKGCSRTASRLYAAAWSGRMSWTPKMRQVDKVEPCP
jgi:hypothetical protein